MSRFRWGILAATVGAVAASVQFADAAPRLHTGLAVAPVAHHTAASTRAALPGTALPQVQGATKVGEPAATQQLNAVVFLRPRNPWLLKQVATRTSGRAAYPRSVLNRLFLPPARQVAAVEGYLRSQGLTVTGRHLFSINTTGTLAANERAFGVSIGLYKGAHGRTFRAPSGAVRLPAGVAAAVQAVGGLDTALRLRRQTGGSVPNTAPAACSGAQDVQTHNPGSLLPTDFASPNGYNINAVGKTGNGQTIGLVEFSSYKRSDITTAQNCFGLAANVSDVSVNGGNSDLSGAAEVELDIQVAQETAPAAAVRVYMAPNDVTNTPAIIDRMVSDGVNVASDSWGLCEPVLPPSIVQAEDTALQFAAANGLSFYVASGDDGSSGCKQVTGSNAPAVDDPSSQPFATSVGGTTLSVSPYQEIAWNRGGGGVSQFWPKPAWQAGPTLSVSGATCGYSNATQCRETPDIALDADPNTGYIIYCAASRVDCGGPPGWFAIGGTSGAAPLMAGITAVANEKAGVDLGFASPFLYTNAGTSVFHDIQTGTNGAYHALVGYDLATGLGSVDANALANALTSTTPAPTPHTAVVTATAPRSGLLISYGRSVTFRGTLTDQNTSLPVANAPVWVQTSIGWGRAVTNSSGQWALTLRYALNRNLTWHAVFTGSDVLTPAVTTTGRRLYVTPHLSAAVNLRRSHGHYNARVGKAFTFSGKSSPNMTGAPVIVQYRRAGGSWKALVSTTAGSRGGYAVRLVDSRRETVYLRWHYRGGVFHRWMSAYSPGLTIRVS